MAEPAAPNGARSPVKWLLYGYLFWSVWLYVWAFPVMFPSIVVSALVSRFTQGLPVSQAASFWIVVVPSLLVEAVAAAWGGWIGAWMAHRLGFTVPTWWAPSVLAAGVAGLMVGSQPFIIAALVQGFGSGGLVAAYLALAVYLAAPIYGQMKRVRAIAAASAGEP